MIKLILLGILILGGVSYGLYKFSQPSEPVAPSEPKPGDGPIEDSPRVPGEDTPEEGGPQPIENPTERPEMPDPIVKFEQLDVSDRVIDVLKENDVQPGDLVGMEDYEEIDGIGPTRAKEIEEAIRQDPFLK